MYTFKFYHLAMYYKIALKIVVIRRRGRCSYTPPSSSTTKMTHNKNGNKSVPVLKRIGDQPEWTIFLRNQPNNNIKNLSLNLIFVM
jgi:hypothetical protein